MGRECVEEAAQIIIGAIEAGIAEEVFGAVRSRLDERIAAACVDQIMAAGFLDDHPVGMEIALGGIGGRPGDLDATAFTVEGGRRSRRGT